MTLRGSFSQSVARQLSVRMSFSWHPDEASLAQILQLLKESQNPDTETQRAVEQVRVVLGGTAKNYWFYPLLL